MVWCALCFVVLRFLLCYAQYSSMLCYTLLCWAVNIAFQYLVVGCVFHFVIILYHMKSMSTFALSQIIDTFLVLVLLVFIFSSPWLIQTQSSLRSNTDIVG